MARLDDRFFRLLLRLLPAEFRGDYGREMAATFRAERREAAGAASLLRLWLATLADVVRTAPGEHLDILRRDLAYAFRMLARRPALTITAVLTLALGVGANTAIFSVIDGVLLAPLPYRDADRLVRVEERATGRTAGTTGYYSFDAARTGARTFEAMAAFAGWTATVAGDGRDAERVVGARVSWNYFQLLGVAPAVGRGFEQGEDHPDRRRVVLISDGFWKRRYDADPAVVGRPVTINQATHLIAGVMPAGFTDLITSMSFPAAEIWSPLGYVPEVPYACRTCRHIHVLGRLHAGVTHEQAEADLTSVYEALAARHPTDYDGPRAVITPLRDYYLGPVRVPLYLLWGAVAVLLVMTCANVANLLLMRASEREEEMTVRRALGVTPARMLRQLLTEATVLSLIGGAAGAALAWWGTALLVAHGPDDIPRLQEVSVNARVLAYALFISVATGVIFGMAPARVLLQQGAPSAAHARRATAGPAAWRYRAALVTANVALSVVLLVGSGLLVRSFVRLVTVDPGLRPERLLAIEMTLSGQAYSDQAAITRFYQTLSDRLRGVPGVTEVTGATQLPLTGSIDRSSITIDARPLDNPAAAPNADRYSVLPGYFRAMGIPLLRGRLFDATDTAAGMPVAIIGQTTAEELWAGEDPIGQRIRVAGGPHNPMRTIVGVVGDVRHYGLHLPPTRQVYIPHAQGHYPEAMLSLVVQTGDGRDPMAAAPMVREVVRALDPLQPIAKTRTYDDIVRASLATRQFLLVLLAVFAATALTLAVVGLYGALSYLVSQRQREIGVRVALGAGGRRIAALVVRQGMTPAVVGLGLGLAGSLAAAGVVETLLYGVSSRDAVTYVAVGVVIAGCALAACLVPAGRAAAVDPAVTLRAE